MYVIKVLVIIFSTLSGYYFFDLLVKGAHKSFGLFAGFLLGLFTIIIRDMIAKVPIKYFVGAFVGFILSISPLFFFTGYLNNPALSIDFLGYTLGIRFILGVLLAYIGISIGIEKIKNVTIPFVDEKKEFRGERIPKVIDTSILIDGRITDIIETGFLEGPFVVPRFVIKELQILSDSIDPVKRAKGRKGLEVLSNIQKLTKDLEISEIDFFRIKEVDLKLVTLAKKLNAKIITMDYNLSKIAELQGIQNLNLNILANALKPSLVAGEVINVFLLKEGKEPGQAIAYLDDGTMIVVENGKKFIGQKIDVEVKSVLQTPSGKIIFSQIHS